MKVLPVVGFVVVASFRNRLTRLVRRLKDPRYLVATAAGLIYFYSMFMRRVFSPHSGVALPPEVTAVLELALVGMAVLYVLGLWVLGPDELKLTFTEAEVQFLLPAPWGRRSLLHYKLVTGLIRLALSAGIATLMSGGVLQGNRLLGFFGLWVVFSVLWLHSTGASFTRASLFQQGRAGLKRKWLTLAVLGLLLGGLGLAASRGGWLNGLQDRSLRESAAWLQERVSTPPLSLLLWPIRALVRLVVASDAAHFARALPAALALLGLHYLWVLESQVSFEDGALEAAERRARRQEQRRARGKLQPPKVGKRSPPFRLSPSGKPEVALVWKNWIAIRRVLGFRLLPLLGLMSGLVFLVVRSGMKGYGPYLVIEGLLLFAVGLTALLGPTLLPVDLRHDLPQVDLLRSYPLSGRQVVAAELMAPALVLTGLQALCVLAALLLSAFYPPPGFAWSLRLTLAAGLLLLGPSICLCSLVVQNAVVLLLPGWVAPTPRGQARGFEAMGQRLVTLAGTLLVLTVGVLPAGVLGGGVLWVGAWLGYLLPAAVLASVLGAAVLLTEVYVSVRLMGQLFDSLDPTD